jgi:hypothetical protein
MGEAVEDPTPDGCFEVLVVWWICCSLPMVVVVM